MKTGGKMGGSHTEGPYGPFVVAAVCPTCRAKVHRLYAALLPAAGPIAGASCRTELKHDLWVTLLCFWGGFFFGVRVVLYVTHIPTGGLDTASKMHPVFQLRHYS